MKRLLTILFIPALLLFGGPSEGYAFDEASLKKLRAMNQCEKCDLQEANLWMANLWMANLSQANLSQADLEKANLKRAKLSEAKLSGANLTDVDLTNTVLGDTKLTDAILCRTKVPWGVENRYCKSWEKLLEVMQNAGP